MIGDKENSPAQDAKVVKEVNDKPEVVGNDQADLEAQAEVRREDESSSSTTFSLTWIIIICVLGLFVFAGVGWFMCRTSKLTPTEESTMKAAELKPVEELTTKVPEPTPLEKLEEVAKLRLDFRRQVDEHNDQDAPDALRKRLRKTALLAKACALREEVSPPATQKLDEEIKSIRIFREDALHRGLRLRAAEMHEAGKAREAIKVLETEKATMSPDERRRREAEFAERRVAPQATVDATIARIRELERQSVGRQLRLDALCDDEGRAAAADEIRRLKPNVVVLRPTGETQTQV